jgi:hypothetical protein
VGSDIWLEEGASEPPALLFFCSTCGSSEIRKLKRGGDAIGKQAEQRLVYIVGCAAAAL